MKYGLIFRALYLIGVNALLRSKVIGKYPVAYFNYDNPIKSEQ